MRAHIDIYQDWSSGCVAMDHLCLQSAGTQVQFPSQAEWVKDLAMSQLWCRLQLLLGSDAWSGNSICHQVAQKREKKVSKLRFTL